MVASAFLAFTIFLSSCSSGGESNGQSGGSSDVTTRSAETAEEPGEEAIEASTPTRAREGGAPSTAATGYTPNEDKTRKNPRLEVTLGGTDGTKSSGRCVSGQHQTRLDGRVPDSFTFAASGDGLGCSIHRESDDTGVLRVVVEADNNSRSVQQTNADQSSIDFSYADGSFSASSSSSSSSSVSNSSSWSQSSQSSR